MDPAAEMLARYDPATRRWSFDKRGELWEAVAAAHRLGRSGTGRRVAVIDNGFDVTVPALAEHTVRDLGRANTATPHGTVVALLVLEVAPRAELLLYPAGAAGGGAAASGGDAADVKVDLDAVAAAIDDAVASGAEIINVSAGRAFRITELLDAERFYADAPITATTTQADLDHWVAQRAAESDLRESLLLPRDRLRAAVEAAAAAGVVIVAAAGNYTDRFLVPAALPQTVAVGFTRIRTEIEDGFQSVALRVPSFTQSELLDFAIPQPPGVIGSSFAAPLLAGLAALAVDPRIVVGLKGSARRSGSATHLWQRHPQDQWRPEHQGVILDLFAAAVRVAPHPHHQPQDRYECPECAFLLYPLYVNYGLFLLGWNRLEHAEVAFATARAIAPHRHEAHANHAVTLRGLAAGLDDDAAVRTLASACSASAAALACTPDEPRYLETFRGLASQLDAALAGDGDHTVNTHTSPQEARP